MTKEFPNKWVKKAVFDVLNNKVVVNELTTEVVLINDGNGNVLDFSSSPFVVIPCYDNRVPTRNTSAYYILLSTQTNVDTAYTYCDRVWKSTLLIDIVTIYNGSGNYGSNLMLNNITDAVIKSLNGLELSNETELKIHNQGIESVVDFNNITSTQNVYRNLMRVNFFIV